jgi:hypothetical protein
MLGLLYEILLVTVLVLVFSESCKRLEIGGCTCLFFVIIAEKIAFFFSESFLSEVVVAKRVGFYGMYTYDTYRMYTY